MNAQDFHFVMIKPTHYDDDGYPIQWLRSAIPSNTLASLNGLAEAARERNALGDSVQIHLHTYDETNKRVRPNKIARDIRRKDGKALIALVGVQSNQFPRATDLAREFMREGLPTAIGGFHVSGCVSMLDQMPEEMVALQKEGVCYFAGEAEERRLDQVFRDAFNDDLKLLYNFMADLPPLEGEPTPILPTKHIQFTAGSHSSFDLGRGGAVPVLLLHDHQRAGTQEPVQIRRRSGADYSRQLCAGHRPVLHHRRQFRPQSGVGATVRPAHSIAGEGEVRHQVHHPGGYALPPD